MADSIKVVLEAEFAALGLPISLSLQSGLKLADAAKASGSGFSVSLFWLQEGEKSCEGEEGKMWKGKK